MILEPPPRERRRRRWSVRVHVLVVGAALVVAFGVGVALGQALSENAQPTDLRTDVRTIRIAPTPPTAGPGTGGGG